MTTRGEYVFTSFDTDDPQVFERMMVRPAGSLSQPLCGAGGFLHEGRFVIG